MRKLHTDDIYLLSEIADKMDLQFPNIEGKTQEQFGGELMMQLFRKMHKAKAEINKLIESATGKDPKAMSLGELKEALATLLKQDGVLDFFK